MNDKEVRTDKGCVVQLVAGSISGQARTKEREAGKQREAGRQEAYF